MAKIIAELCQNHNGNLDVIKNMIKAAAEAGADYIKIQSMLSDDLSYRERFEKGVINKNGEIIANKRPYKDEYERLKSLDLDNNAHYMFIEECVNHNVIPLTTVFTRTRIPFLASLPWPEKTIKISSFDCRSLPLLKDLIDAGFEKLFISTGTLFNDEIEKTSKFLIAQGVEFTFLHCISVYPTPLHEGHLNRINYLRKFSDNVGFSDHSQYEKDGLKLSTASLTYNIDLIERHFTILPKNQTKDGIVSLNKEQLLELVLLSKKNLKDVDLFKNNIVTPDEYYQIAGLEKRELSSVEMLNRDYYQGRFVNKMPDGSYIYNWEDKDVL